MHGGASAADFGEDIETVWLQMQHPRYCVSAPPPKFSLPKMSCAQMLRD